MFSFRAVWRSVTGFIAVVAYDPFSCVGSHVCCSKAVLLVPYMLMLSLATILVVKVSSFFGRIAKVLSLCCMAGGNTGKCQVSCRLLIHSKEFLF